MVTYLSLFCSARRAALSSRQHLVLENLALRQQLAVLSRRSRRPRLDPSDRLFWSFLSQLWLRWQSAVVFVQPETVWGAKMLSVSGRVDAVSIGFEIRKPNATDDYTLLRGWKL